MNDNFDDLLKRWLRDRGATDRSAIEALAGHVAVLPPRRRQMGPLAAAAAIIVAVGLVAFALVPRQGSVTSSPSAPLPPDPAAFAGDARLARCGATADTALDAFEMARARDYRLHLPAMLLSPELDVDAPGFVVVYRDMQPFAVLGAPPPAGQTWPARSLVPGHHDVCILVGADPATAERNVYDDVDITGLTAVIATGDLSSPSGEPPATQTPGSDASVTPAPAPAWAADLAGQLDCTGAVTGIGGEVPDSGSDASGATPEAAVLAFLGPGNPYASLPAAGFGKIHAESHWASFGYAFAGRLKAIIVVSDLHPIVDDGHRSWMVVGLRACDASEFDPAVPLTFPVTIWTDAQGQRVSTDTIHSFAGPAHCGWETSIWLHVGKELYFRDPEGVMAHWTRTRFAADVALPGSAVDSGFRSGDLALWLVPGGDAYVVTSSQVERWPRSTDPQIGCM